MLACSCVEVLFAKLLSWLKRIWTDLLESGSVEAGDSVLKRRCGDAGVGDWQSNGTRRQMSASRPRPSRRGLSAMGIVECVEERSSYGGVSVCSGERRERTDESCGAWITTASYCFGGAGYAR